MSFKEVKEILPQGFVEKIDPAIEELRPAQQKAVDAGLLKGKNLLICTPTASGKTFIAELAGMQAVYNKTGKAVYIVPLKALAQEKYKEFKKRYTDKKIGISIGDPDSPDKFIGSSDFIFTTSEKLDASIRHSVAWVREISVIIVDEIHLLNDASRGPTLEILLTILKQMIPDAQIIGLSATIGNPEELAEWLDATLVTDAWRPIPLSKGIMQDHEVEFFD